MSGGLERKKETRFCLMGRGWAGGREGQYAVIDCILCSLWE